jgi:hypothetical protein
MLRAISNDSSVSKNSQVTSNNQYSTSIIQNDETTLYEVLVKIQLESFWPLLKDQLQITRFEHFNYVKIKDLEKIGMSKPAIRRLLDSVNKQTKIKGNQFMPSRPPPPVPAIHQRLGSSHEAPAVSGCLPGHDQLNINRSKVIILKCVFI